MVRVLLGWTVAKPVETGVSFTVQNRCRSCFFKSIDRVRLLQGRQRGSIVAVAAELAQTFLARCKSG